MVVVAMSTTAAADLFMCVAVRMIMVVFVRMTALMGVLVFVAAA